MAGRRSKTGAETGAETGARTRRGAPLWLAAATLPGVPALAADGPYHFRDAPIAWTACADPMIDGLDCAVYATPLDYRQEDGPTVELALRRMPAQGGKPVGVPFFNPGGPGGTGSVQFPQWYQPFPAAVRRSFEILSRDPRGIGESTQAGCFEDAGEAAALLGDFGAFPVSYDAQRAWREAYGTFAEGLRCERGRDPRPSLDRGHRARPRAVAAGLGGAQLLDSYGILLGATYADLFPATPSSSTRANAPRIMSRPIWWRRACPARRGELLPGRKPLSRGPRGLRESCSPRPQSREGLDFMRENLVKILK